MEKVSLKKSTTSSSLSEENVLDWNLVQKSFEKSFGSEIDFKPIEEFFDPPNNLQA